MAGKTSLWHTWRAGLPQGEQVKAAALRRLKLWASFLDPDFRHSQHVARLALQLYDGMAKNIWAAQGEEVPGIEKLNFRLGNQCSRTSRHLTRNCAIVYAM